MGRQGHKKVDKHLSKKEMVFANAILDGAGLSKAALIAGCSPKSPQTAANRIYYRPHVQKYLETEKRVRLAKRRELTEVDDLWITEKFKQILDRCMQARPVMRFDHERGELVQATDEATGEPLFMFDSVGAIKAAENLAKHIGYYELDNKQKSPTIVVSPVQNNQTNIINFFSEEDKGALLDGYTDPESGDTD